MTRDEKIFDIAVANIRRNSMESADWKHTSIGRLHHAFRDEFLAPSEELVLASGFISSQNWYAFTTRRIASCFEGSIIEANPENLIRSEFENFKGFGPNAARQGEIPIELALLNFSDGGTLRFQFETGSASMVPIYAAMYWERKHRFLDKLITSEELKQYKHR